MNNLQELVDDIWFYAGDRSVDFSWYTKRALLACVYKSTEFYMLQDESEGQPFTEVCLLFDISQSVCAS